MWQLAQQEPCLAGTEKGDEKATVAGFGDPRAA
jgi:hypothetical protein